MPALIPTEFYGTITWLGRVADRDAALESAALTEIFAGFDGPEGEAWAHIEGQLRDDDCIWETEATRDWGLGFIGLSGDGASDHAAADDEREDALLGLSRVGVVGDLHLILGNGEGQQFVDRSSRHQQAEQGDLVMAQWVGICDGVDCQQSRSLARVRQA